MRSKKKVNTQKGSTTKILQWARKTMLAGRKKGWCGPLWFNSLLDDCHFNEAGMRKISAVLTSYMLNHGPFKLSTASKINNMISSRYVDDSKEL